MHESALRQVGLHMRAVRRRRRRTNARVSLNFFFENFGYVGSKEHPKRGRLAKTRTLHKNKLLR